MKELLDEELGKEKSDIAFCLFKERVEQGKIVDLEIEGDSMSPFLSRGDTVSVRKVEFRDLRRGDIVVYRVDKRLYAHRYIHLAPSDKLVTKGDNNSHFDSLPIPAEQLIGKVVLVKKDKGVIALEVVSWKVINYFLASVSALHGYVVLFLRFLNETFFRDKKGRFGILIIKGLHFIFSVPFNLTVRMVNLDK